MNKSIWYLTAALMTGLAAHGVVAQDMNFCSENGGGINTDITKRVQAVKPGRIAAGPAVSLLNQPEDTCNTDERCRVAGALPLNAGHDGIELGRHKSWVCVALPGKRPLDVWTGWLPESRWQRTADEQVPSRWVGVWQNDHAKISIQSTEEAHQLSVTGHAIWAGRTEHFGEFALIGTPINGVLSTPPTAHESDCHVALRIVGSFVFAADDGHCGGMNVTFDGMYRFRFRRH